MVAWKPGCCHVRYFWTATANEQLKRSPSAPVSVVGGEGEGWGSFGERLERENEWVLAGPACTRSALSIPWPMGRFKYMPGSIFQVCVWGALPFYRGAIILHHWSPTKLHSSQLLLDSAPQQALSLNFWADAASHSTVQERSVAWNGGSPAEGKTLFTPGKSFGDHCARSHPLKLPHPFSLQWLFSLQTDTSKNGL